MRRPIATRRSAGTSCVSIRCAAAAAEGSALRGGALGAPFASEGGESWEGIGLSAATSQGLVQSGLAAPSATQALAVPPVLEGRDTVIAAETGSGKTVAYLAPLLDRLIARPWREEDAPFGPPCAIVLCPNKQLCEQVASVAETLARSSQADVSVVSVATDPIEPRLTRRTLFVGTPRHIVDRVFEDCDVRGVPLPDAWCVVLDEVDMLLTGDFERHTMEILGWSKAEDKRRKIEHICACLGISRDAFFQLKRHVRQAGLRDGVQAMLDLGVAPGGVDSAAAHSDADVCQYVFAGATIPDQGLKSVSKQMRKLFPRALWLSGAGLHNPSSLQALEAQDFVRVATAEAGVAAVVAAIESNPGRIIVFNRNVKQASACATVLNARLGSMGAGPDGGAWKGKADAPRILEFHNGVPRHDRAENLERFRSLKHAVLVCTDSASRGLDVPLVSCVVQFGFAATAVDYLHRIGRTARAGHPGRAVSVYMPQDDALVDAVRRAVAEGRPVEKAFSRRRSFRKKLRKERAAREGEA